MNLHAIVIFVLFMTYNDDYMVYQIYETMTIMPDRLHKRHSKSRSIL